MNFNIPVKFYPYSINYPHLSLGTVMAKFHFLLANNLQNRHLDSLDATLTLNQVIAIALYRYFEYNNTHCRYSLWHRHGKAGRIRAKEFWEQNGQRSEQSLAESIMQHLDSEDSGSGHCYPNSFNSYLAQYVLKYLELKRAIMISGFSFSKTIDVQFAVKSLSSPLKQYLEQLSDTPVQTSQSQLRIIQQG